MKKKTIRQKLEVKLWSVVKDYIRLRDKNKCQRCSKEVRGQGAHTSHVYCKKVYYSMKYDEWNLKLLCFWCHKLWHNNPLDNGWFEQCFPERYDYLQERKQIVRKLTLMDLEDKIGYYKDKIIDLKIGGEICKNS